MDIDPKDTLNLAETESTPWAEAQVMNIQHASQQAEGTHRPMRVGRWCFIDGSSKDKEPFSGQGWYSILEGFEGLMGARNIRASLSPLHLEVEALIWAMECMRNLRQFHVTFATDCSQLVKMVSEPEEWPEFESYLKDIKMLKSSFLSSEIIHVPRTENIKADNLAWNARKLTIVFRRLHGCKATSLVRRVNMNLLLLMSKKERLKPTQKRGVRLLT